MGKVDNTHPTVMLSCYDLCPLALLDPLLAGCRGWRIYLKMGRGVCLPSREGLADPSREPEHLAVTHPTGMFSHVESFFFRKKIT